MPLDAPLPGLNLPDVPQGIDSVYEERERHVASAASYWSALKRFRKQMEAYHRETRPPFEHREILVRFVVSGDRVGCVVDWRDGRVGRAGLLHRVAGPLRLNPREVRRLGPGVALHVLIRELERVSATL
jgi:hypothetical protein